MSIKSKCDSCELKGYSPELCKAHMRNMVKGKKDADCPHYTNSFIKYGATAVVGAGIGLVAACGSVAVIPSVALKALFGHVAVAKVSAGASGTVAGAGINLFRQTKKEHGKDSGDELKKNSFKKDHKKRRHFYFPLTLNGGNLNG